MVIISATARKSEIIIADCFIRLFIFFLFVMSRTLCAIIIICDYQFGASCLMNVGRVVLGQVLRGASSLESSRLLCELSCTRSKFVFECVCRLHIFCFG